MNPPSEKVSQPPQSSASSPPPSEPAATPMEESPPLRSPKRPVSAAKATSRAPSKAGGGLEIVSHSSAKAKAAANPVSKAAAAMPDTPQPTAGPASAPAAATLDSSAPPVPEGQVTTPPATPGAQAEPATKEKDRHHPISPPSEPMQYRAIGLVRGVYEASEEQVTRGNIHTADGSKLDAVLLGRVISLVKKHVDLTKEHLWVVYPRTREEGGNLHVQVVGIWEPESLSKEGEEPAEAEAGVAEAAAPAAPKEAEAVTEVRETAVGTEAVEVPVTREPVSSPETVAGAAAIPASPTAPVSADELPDGFFSIRGEIIHYVQEAEKLIVKIRQQPRKPSQRPKAFKLTLKGTLDSPKVLRHFWELEVQRQGNDLVVQKGTLIGIMPPVKRRSSDRNTQKKRPPNANKKQFKRPRQSAGPEKPGESGMPPRAGGPKPKPMKRNDPERRSPRVPRNPL